MSSSAERNKKWRAENKELTKQYDRARYPGRKDYLSKKSKESIKRTRQKIAELLGIKCRICGEKERRLVCHEIHGEKHSTSPSYILKQIKDFVRLCYGCHQAVHWNMRHLSLDWDQIQGFL